MVTKSVENSAETFVCDACGFKYASEDLAQTCEEACTEQGICRNDVAKQALVESEPSDTNHHENVS